MKRETDQFFLDTKARANTTTKKKDSNKSDIKKTSPTASSHSELIPLILLRSYHSPKAIEKSSEPLPLKIRASQNTKKNHRVW